MILIGKGRSRRLSELVNNIRCPHCGENGSLLMEGYQEYLIFGLPVFPISKTVTVTCAACKKYFRPSEISNKVFEGVQYIKNKIKPAVWMFLLPIVIGTAFFLKLMSTSNPEPENADTIDNIQIGDIYSLRIDDHRYNKMKVLDVKDGAVVFHKSGHASVKLRKLAHIDSFDGDTIVYSKEDLMKLKSDYKIIDIAKE